MGTGRNAETGRNIVIEKNEAAGRNAGKDDYK